MRKIITVEEASLNDLASFLDLGLRQHGLKALRAVQHLADAIEAAQPETPSKPVRVRKGKPVTETPPADPPAG